MESKSNTREIKWKGQVPKNENPPTPPPKSMNIGEDNSTTSGKVLDARELRIGNYILHQGLIVRVQALLPDNQFCDYMPEIVRDLNESKGIELNEEWLLRFGFENITKEWYTDKCFRIKSEIGTKFDYWLNEQRLYKNEEIFLSCVYYVHQLQNLYFALTGSELTLKEKL